MKKLWIFGLIISAIVVFEAWDFPDSSAQTQQQQNSNALQLAVDSSPVIENPQRIGVNLAHWTDWGAAQFSRNILKNPGFEGKVDRRIVIVTRADAESFSDGKDLGSLDGWWNGASYNIRTGPHAGTEGTIASSLRNGADGLPQYFSQSPLPPLQVNDVIVLTKTNEANPVARWWIPDNSMNRITVTDWETRPGSPGKQSLSLQPTTTEAASINYYIDHLAGNRGKFLTIEGPWKFSIWARADQDDSAMLEIILKRNNGTPNIFYENIPLTSNWQEYAFDFEGKDQGSGAILSLSINAKGSSRVSLDDIFLGPKEPANSFFRQEMIDTLKKLHPSYLRESQGQLGDIFENRIAEPFARRAHKERIGGASSFAYSYSLNEFLDLCEMIGANPWVIIPPVLTDPELTAFGEYLAEKASTSRFSDVYLEFGNENWNWLFRPQGIPIAEAHGSVATRAFQKIEEAAKGKTKLIKVVNGQHVVPYVSMQFLDSTPNADNISVAPYFFYKINAGTSDSKALELLFKDDGNLSQQTADEAKSRGKTFSIYEVNLHTTQGTAPREERNRVVSGMASGTALAKNLIRFLTIGYDPIMVFSLAGLENNTWDIQDKVNLWGIARDVSYDQRLRPTGLAVEMLNHAISGSMHAIQPINAATPETEKLTSTAFKADNEWRAAIVSENDKPVDVDVQFPDDGHPIATKVMTLQANSPFDTNEEQENVKVVTQPANLSDRVVSLTIPAWGFVVVSSGFSEEAPSVPQPAPPPPEPEPAPPPPPPEPQPAPPPPPPEPEPEQPPQASPETSPENLQKKYIDRQQDLIIQYREKMQQISDDDPGRNRKLLRLQRQYIREQRKLIREYREQLQQLRSMQRAWST